MRYACLALVMAGLLTVPGIFAAAPQGPRIYIAEPRADLGTVAEGAVVDHVFEIKNVGDEPLVIQRLQPS
jgi:hypothetical protein